MAMFTVSAIIDRNTFEVSSEWGWDDETRTCNCLAGYDSVELHAYGSESTRNNLHHLINPDFFFT